METSQAVYGNILVSLSLVRLSKRVIHHQVGCHCICLVTCDRGDDIVAAISALRYHCRAINIVCRLYRVSYVCSSGTCISIIIIKLINVSVTVRMRQSSSLSRLTHKKVRFCLIYIRV